MVRNNALLRCWIHDKNSKWKDCKNLCIKETGIPEFSKDAERIETNQDDTPLKTLVLEQVNMG